MRTGIKILVTSAQFSAAVATSWSKFQTVLHHSHVTISNCSVVISFVCFIKVCTPLLQFIFGTAVDQMSSLKTREGLSELKCPPTPTNSKFMTDMMAETPKSSIRRSLRDVGTPKTPTVLNASFAKMIKQKLLTQGCQILLELLTMNDDELNGNLNLITSLGTVANI